jgi:hypothetical protein
MPCVNPIQYFIDYVDFYISQNPGSTIYDVLNELNLFPISANLCCEGACDEFYMIVGEASPDLVQFSEDVTFNMGKGGCCLNLYYLYNNYKEFVDTLNTNDSSSFFIEFTRSYSVCCSNNQFAKCVEDLADFLNADEFNEWLFQTGTSRGIFEYNILKNGYSFCSLVEALKTKTPSVALEYIIAILEKGLVISCKDEGTVITSALKYANEYGNSTL